MDNPYCNTTQFAQLYDSRVINELSDDTGSATVTPSATTIQFWLDVAASELESLLANRWALPLASVPLILTKLVGIMAIKTGYGHRTDLPKGLTADLEWCEDFLEGLRTGTRSLAGIDRNGVPRLEATASKSGKSRFDNLPLQDQSGNTISSVQGGVALDLPGD